MLRPAGAQGSQGGLGRRLCPPWHFGPAAEEPRPGPHSGAPGLPQGVAVWQELQELRILVVVAPPHRVGIRPA